MSDSSVSSTSVNPSTSVSDSTKNQDNDQNESNHSSNLKDIELVLNASKNHRVKRGHGITDSIPGIQKNRYGYGMADSCFEEICWLVKVLNDWIPLKSIRKSYAICWFRFGGIIHRVRSKRKLFLLHNTLGIGNRLQLFCGLYFISIRHNCSIVSRIVLHFYYDSSSSFCLVA